MIERAAFFDAIRPHFGGRLTESQVKGVGAILDAQDKLGWSDMRWRAYTLATALQEAGAGMVPVRENLSYRADRIAEIWPRLAGRAAQLAGNPEALAEAAYGGRNGNGPEGSGDGWLYRGRGVVQVTGRANYRTSGARLGMGDAMERDPEIAMEMDVSAMMLCQGSAEGWWRPGHSLPVYFPRGSEGDARAARAIINVDVDRHGEKVAKHHRAFLAALEAARSAPVAVAPPSPGALALLEERVAALEAKMAAIRRAAA